MAAKVTMREQRATAPEAVQAAAIPAGADLSEQARAFNEGKMVTVKDAKGRTLTLKRLNILEEMDLLAAAGAENSRNEKWMMYATMAACVRSIDGDHMSPAPTPRIMRGNIQQIGSEGVAAVSRLLGTIAAEEAEGKDEFLETAKN